MENKCSLEICNKPAKYGRLCCCIAHSRKLGGLRAGVANANKIRRKYQNLTKPLQKEKTKPKSYKDWSPTQKGKYIAYIVERRKKRDKSMPVWADKEKIQQLYIEAKRLSAETGIKHEVDHIIPSNHKLVCGLHVENNLQIISRMENQRKSNKFIVE